MNVNAVTMASKQRGAVLIVGLIMVLLMTIVGLAAIRSTGLQETMAGNMRERNLAFQAAEASLRVGEALVEDNNVDGLDFSGATAGLVPDLNQPGMALPPVHQWTDEQWAANAVQVDMGLENIGDANQPWYVVEELMVLSFNASQSTGGAIDQQSLQNTNDLQMEFFRVTSRGLSGSGESQAVLQSTYRKN